MVRYSHRLKRSVEKTLPDLATLLTGRAPGFVYGRPVRGLPVFTYHAVDGGFERDLRLLAEGGYRTVGAEELEAAVEGRSTPDGRAVVLTFDDGHVSLVRVAEPLLARFGFRAIAFVVAGLVPERTTEDLAGWDDLRAAVARGTLEVGGHSLHHHHVPVRSTIVGFVAPGTPTGFDANIPIPRWDGAAPCPPGTPIFRGRPRYLARRGFRPDPAAVARVIAAAAEPGFFAERHWARRLRRTARPMPGGWETPAEAARAVVDDMRAARERIEDHCPNRASSHCCYPWYAGDGWTHRRAAEAGITVVHGGLTARTRPAAPGLPARVRRLPPDLLWRLPGPARRSLPSLLAERVRGWSPARPADADSTTLTTSPAP